MELVMALFPLQETGHLGEQESERNVLYTFTFCSVTCITC